MDDRTGGSDSLLTEDHLEIGLGAFEHEIVHEFRRQMLRFGFWVTAAAVVGMAISVGLVAVGLT